MAKLLLKLFLLFSLCTVRGAAITLTVPDGREFKDSLELLQVYLEKSTGARPQCSGNSDGDGLNVRLEMREDMATEPEAFVLEFPAKDRVVIAGGTPLAIRHGVCEFLERFYGIRWLFPGEDGEHVPRVSDLPEFPGESIRRSPVYRIRTFALDHKRKGDYTWAARNKGIFSYDFWSFPGYTWFHHNLPSLLPPEKYASEHPEFFPVIKGKRLIPGKGAVSWQYCFTAPGIADELAAVTRQRFCEKPQMVSMSFGVNDGDGYCECEACLKADGHRKNSLGFDDRSPSYLTCINQTAERCAASGRTFGFLAYASALEVPDGMKLHPSLCPFITYELLFWADPEKAENARRITRDWTLAGCGVVGWYDYLEHDWFLIPKISLHIVPDALRWGAANGVRHYYAEAMPSEDWHTGPMLWLILKLAWEPGQDVEALLDDWCRAAVGDNAAPYLKEWYQACSDFWEKKVPSTAFFRENRLYLGRSSGYLDAMKPDWPDRMKQILDRVVELAAPERKSRAEAIRKTFLDREAAIRSCIRNNKLREEAEKMTFRTIASFEFNEPHLWGSWQRPVSKGKFFYAPGEGIGESGAQAMDLSGARGNMVFMTVLNVRPNQVYRITARVRTQGVDQTAVAGLEVAWSAPGRNWLDPAFNAEDRLPEDGSFAWRKLSVLVTAPDIPDCGMRIMLNGGKTARGIFYWDDVTVEQAIPPEEIKKDPPSPGTTDNVTIEQ